MSRIGLNRNKVRLRGLFGIRARLMLLALILVGPLMVDRIRALADIRARQISLVSQEFANLAAQSATAQRQVVSSVEAVLKSAAYLHAMAGAAGRGCAITQVSPRDDMPWMASLSVAALDGRVLCSTTPELVGTDLGSRGYFKTALATGTFVLSDFLIGTATRQPAVIAAYPVPTTADAAGAVMIAAVKLDWMSRIMSRLGDRPGISVCLVDRAGTVLATPPDQAGMIGRPLDDPKIRAALAAQAGEPDTLSRSASVTAADGSRRELSFSRIPGTGAQLVASIDETGVAAAADRDIRNACVQLGLVCLFLLLGALVAAERIIIRPLDKMVEVAKRFGRGEWSARVPRTGLPAEYVPLARALNGMAALLGDRERELLAHNDRLTVIASIDMLSGLANRRGFQSRLDFEWLKAQQCGSDLALLMIDVDHFKLFNDTYGHPEGDACLARIGEVLAGIADSALGFAARYGGEEFCLLLPNTGAAEALRIGETVRGAVRNLDMPHTTSAYQSVTVSVGVACAAPCDPQQPRDLMDAADAALYAAKHRGRNTIVEHGFVRLTDPVLSLAS